MRRVKLTSSVKMDSPYLVGDANAELALDDATAEFAVNQGHGVYVSDHALGPTRAELEAVEARIGTLRELGEAAPEVAALLEDPSTRELAAAEDREADEVAAEDGPESAERPKRPYGNAPKSAWVRYAVDMGGIDDCPVITEERAELQTKADLMSRYGSRLGDEDQ